MLFRLQYIENHDLEKVHELLTHFFRELQTATVWSEKLFPEWYHPVFGKNLKFQTDVLKPMFDKLDSEYNLMDLFNGDNRIEREKLYNAFICSNDIQNLCNNTRSSVIDFTKLDKNDILYKIIPRNKDGESLMSNLYKDVLSKENLISTVLDLENMKEHYEAFYTKNPTICTFCGLERVPLPNSEGKADYDHYIDKARYAFSSVNPRNLVPIGKYCNSLVKGTKNILINESGNRCLAFYPYQEREGLHFKTECVIPPNSFDGGEWEVMITPIIDNEVTKEKISTWDRVFNIIARYAEHIKRNANDLLDRVLKKGGDITQNIQNMVKNYQNEEHPFLLKDYDRYIPEKIFFEYYQQNPEYLLQYQAVLNKCTNNAPIFNDLD